MNAYDGNGWWWLRSPYYDYSDHARYVDDYGNAYYDDYYVSDDRYGVVPALNLTLS